MKEFVEKMIGRLEEKFKYNSEQAEIWRNGSDTDSYFREKADLYMDRANIYGETIRIVNQLAEEYNNGWIPCSERLPNKSGKYLITQERYRLEDRLCNRPIAIEVDYVDFNAIDNSWNRARFFKVIAWQPLPQPYKENENGKI